MSTTLRGEGHVGPLNRLLQIGAGDTTPLGEHFIAWDRLPKPKVPFAHTVGNARLTTNGKRWFVEQRGKDPNRVWLVLPPTFEKRVAVQEHELRVLYDGTILETSAGDYMFDERSTQVVHTE
jgi:hypothetical protein